MESYWGVFKAWRLTLATLLNLPEIGLLISRVEVIARQPHLSMRITWDNPCKGCNSFWHSPPSFLYYFILIGDVPERNSMLMCISIYITAFFLHTVNACDTKFTTCDIAQVAFNSSLSILLRLQPLESDHQGFKPMTYSPWDLYKGVLPSLTLFICSVRLIMAPPSLA